MIELHGLTKADAAYTLYYDETNNARRLHVMPDAFNVKEPACFVLGGVGHLGEPRALDLPALHQAVQLQPTSSKSSVQKSSRQTWRGLGTRPFWSTGRWAIVLSKVQQREVRLGCGHAVGRFAGEPVMTGILENSRAHGLAGQTGAQGAQFASDQPLGSYARDGRRTHQDAGDLPQQAPVALRTILPSQRVRWDYIYRVELRAPDELPLVVLIRYRCQGLQRGRVSRVAG